MSRADVAIIGISGIYPEANDLSQFYANLCEGRDSVREISARRKQLVGLDTNAACPEIASLDQVDTFDFEFFGISLKEAEYMDPQQRLLLQLAAEAIGNAGYSLKSLRGSRTAVIVSSSNNDYSQLLAETDPTAVTGNLPAALAGRIAYALDLRGPAQVIDTACSSSLVAIYEACQKVARGDADTALAGGLNLFFRSDPLGSGSIGIAAPDGRARAFDEAASGTGWGEGGGLVMLKLLDRAIADGDHIHAIIKGGAVNQDGGRSNGLAAPSPHAQAEVITEAWKNAGINPKTITYIEAHGTGTELGDPIEIQGITDAFRPHNSGKPFCAIGSVKTNIGHLIGAAGIAGLTKVVLSLRHEKLLPSIHFKRPNPFIDFERAPVFVNTQLRDWQVSDSIAGRRAGLSSFGLSGTNAHLVIEQAPARQTTADNRTEVLVTISGKTPAALARNLAKLAEALKNSENSLADIAYTLNQGRDHYACRQALVARNKQQLTELIEAAVAQTGNAQRPPKGDVPVVLLFPGDLATSAAITTDLASRYEAFRQAVDQCRDLTPGLIDEPQVQCFIFQYALYRLWQAHGIITNRVIGTGLGNLAVSVITGKTGLADGLRLAASYQDPQTPFDQARLKTVLAAMTQAQKPLFLSMGAGGFLAAQVRRAGDELGGIEVLSGLPASGDESLLHILANLYGQGVAIDWEQFYQGQQHMRAELPAYQFEPTRCWARIARQVTADNHAQVAAAPPATETFGRLVDAPGSVTETALAAIWGEALKVKEVGLDDDYFDLGGNSLNGAQMIDRVNARFQANLYFEEIYDYSTLRALAEYIGAQSPTTAAAPQAAAETSAQGAALPATRERQDLSLSSGQQRLWFLHQLEPESPFYNIPIAARLRGTLDVDRLARCLNEVVRRHEVLRATYSNRDGRAVPVIAGDLALDLPVIDLRVQPVAARLPMALEIASVEARRPFDLSCGPLLRAVLLRMDEDDHLVALTMHHITSDNWSAALLIQEIATLYAAYSNGEPSPLPELTSQYTDYAEWQQQWLKGEEINAQLQYWKAQLSGELPALGLPTDRPRPAAQSYRGGRESVSLPFEVTAALKGLSRRENATLFMTMFAAFNVLLQRYSGQDDIIVGAPIAGRRRAETENLIGFFVNTLALRTDLSGDPDFLTLLKRVRDTALGAYAHQDLPFEKLVEALQPERSLSRAPLFQALFVFQNIAVQAVELPGLTMSIIEPESGTAQFDLIMSMIETESGMDYRIEYSTDLFDAPTIRRMLGHFNHLLAAIAADPCQPISRLPLLDGEELNRLLVEWNDSGTVADTPLTVHERFEQQAARTPQDEAVIFDGESLSYAELNARANQLARTLQSLGVGTETRVAICMERSSEVIVAMLAALKAGAAYVPLDPAYPRERLAFMLEDAAIKIVMTQARLAASIPDHTATVVHVDRDWPSIASQSRDNIAGRASADNAAYVIYTSGSTGRPKGVVVTHRGLGNFAQAMVELMRLKPGDRFLEFASLSFDASAVQIYPTLLSGAALVLHERPTQLSNAELLQLCEQQRITVLDLPAGFWRQWIEDLAAHGVHPHAPLRYYMTGGESLSSDKLRTWASLAAADAMFLSSYGPTEATVTTTIYQIVASHVAGFNLPAVPTGRPIANASVYLLDQHMQPVPTGVPGEVFIGGTGLARGYLNRPDLTASRFVPSPFGAAGDRLYRTGDLARYQPDGNLEFLGRIDDQVKIRGFRVELGEIEATLSEHPDLQQAIVLAREDTPGQKRLVAYVVASPGSHPTSDAFKHFLRERLPDYMVPTAIVMLDSFPLTSNAKIDRQALPAPEPVNGDTARTYVAPRNSTEAMIAAIWQEILGLEHVGVYDDFFVIGGHSLLATQVVSRLQDSFQVEFPLRRLFETPMIAGIAQVVESARRAPAACLAPPLVRVARDGELPLSFAQQRLWFLAQLDSEGAAFNIPSAVKLEGELNITALEASFNQIVGRHEALRTSFVTAHGKPVQVINPPAPLRIPITDLSLISEAEQPYEAERAMIAEAQFPFDLGRSPLIRMRLLRLGPEQHILLFSLHHIAFDGWSLGILVKEIAALYDAYARGQRPVLAELPIQYADFATWQRQWLQGAALEGLVDYWKRQLQGAPSSLMLPTDRPRPANMAHRGARHYFDVDAGPSRRLRELNQREGATMFMTALAAFVSLLHRYSGQEDIVVGADIANRNHLETEQLIGCFFNHIVLRANLGGNPGFRELLGRVRETTLAAYAHQDLPFDKLVEVLQPERTAGRTPLFQVLFVFQNAPLGQIQLPGLTLTPIETDAEVSKFDLTLFMSESEDGLKGAFEYNTELFEASTIARFAQRFQVLLAEIADDPDREIASLSLGDEEETGGLIGAFNDDLEQFANSALSV